MCMQVYLNVNLQCKFREALWPGDYCIELCTLNGAASLCGREAIGNLTETAPRQAYRAQCSLFRTSEHIRELSRAAPPQFSSWTATATRIARRGGRRAATFHNLVRHVSLLMGRTAHIRCCRQSMFASAKGIGALIGGTTSCITSH